MFKKIIGAVLVLAVAVAGAIWGVKFFGAREMSKGADEASETAGEVIAEEKAKTVEEQAGELLARMSLEQKVGQMLVVRNSYTEMTEELKAELEAIQPGGYVIFAENITTLEGTKKLISETRAAIEEASTVELLDGTTQAVPAIMAVDQEGGLVQRLQAITDEPPAYVGPMATIGATGSSDTAYQTGQLLGEECKSVGLNVDFAPVADIFSNPQNKVIGERAFGTDKETVATMATATAKGLQVAGVVPVYKHFPGHGDTITDSHEALPVVSKTLAELEENELYPFREAIKAGAEMMMVAHIALPNVTGDYTPASLSQKMITEILRGQMGYRGVVVTDGLDMGALTANYTNAEIAVGAVKAGADILLTPVSPSEAKEAILAAVADGSIPPSRIDESVKRILELKLKRLTF